MLGPEDWEELLGRCLRGWGARLGLGAGVWRRGGYPDTGKPRSPQVCGMKLEGASCPLRSTSGNSALPQAEGEALGGHGHRPVLWAVIRGSPARDGQGCDDQPAEIL